MNGKPYTTAIDIWSLGATVIEMAEGRPSMSNIPLRLAINMIQVAGGPYLQNPHQVSFLLRNWAHIEKPFLHRRSIFQHDKKLKSFLKAMLQREAIKRASAEDLLGHKFLDCVDNNFCIRELFQPVPFEDALPSFSEIQELS